MRMHTGKAPAEKLLQYFVDLMDVSIHQHYTLAGFEYYEGQFIALVHGGMIGW